MQRESREQDGEYGQNGHQVAQSPFATGQTFLHRLFGYRGVVLFPWMARVYDRDIPIRARPGKGSGSSSNSSNSSSSGGDLTTEDDGGGSTVSSEVKVFHCFCFGLMILKSQ